MKKLVAVCIAILVIPLASLAMQKNGSNDWLDNNIVVTIEIQQANQAVQKFSLITAKKEISFHQIMTWKIDSSSTEPTPIFLEFHGKLDVHQNDKYLLDSELVLKIPNFVRPGDQDLPFLENGWRLGIVASEGKMMNVVDNSDLKISLSIKERTPEEK